MFEGSLDGDRFDFWERNAFSFKGFARNLINDGDGDFWWLAIIEEDFIVFYF